MKIQFSEKMEGDTLDLQNGEYSRSFKRGEQPFEATEEEWEYLRRTGFFEPVKEIPAPPQGEQEQQQSEGDRQNAAAPQRAGNKAQTKN